MIHAFSAHPTSRPADANAAYAIARHVQQAGETIPKEWDKFIGKLFGATSLIVNPNMRERLLEQRAPLRPKFRKC